VNHRKPGTASGTIANPVQPPGSICVLRVRSDPEAVPGFHTPDEMRGRVSALNGLFIGTSNELGAFESGFVANLFGPVFSVVFGGAGTIVVAGITAWLSPGLRKYGRLGEKEST